MFLFNMGMRSLLYNWGKITFSKRWLFVQKKKRKKTKTIAVATMVGCEHFFPFKRENKQNAGQEKTSAYITKDKLISLPPCFCLKRSGHLFNLILSQFNKIHQKSPEICDENHVMIFIRLFDVLC